MPEVPTTEVHVPGNCQPSVRHSRDWPKGSVIRLDHRSTVLRDNPWSDPTDRSVYVYLPASYSEILQPFIALWDLAAFSNSGRGHLNWRNHGENLPDRLDRLMGTGAMPAVVVVIPDCYTSLGGNQYINTAGVGQYADYLVTELVPFISSRVNVIDNRNGRGLFGKSSGGFGALHHGMKYSHAWGAVASHAGDVGFDLVYRPAFADTCAALLEHEGDSIAFIREFWCKNNPSAQEFSALMILAMAASYDPDPGQPRCIRLPFDIRTCALDEQRWARWLTYDPLNLTADDAAGLKSLHGLYIDVGSYDQYRIQYGCRALADKLNGLGVGFHFEEFNGSHSAIDWRLDHSLPFLAGALKKALDAAT